ncbi:MAG: cytochrome c-type biogenesis CcmF C-terminal domain-containing protein [Desulfovibrionaceae bacterium]|nr:cytochrome c-type biogenesis CcmF C-terminal domain-containing protein [Desulfovibrionaceae bacterium]
MYHFAYFLLLLAQIASIGGAGYALAQAWSGRTDGLRVVEKIHFPVTGAFALSSSILLYALSSRDYSLNYVAGYTDNALDFFYCLAAFWAGQPGSMLFWALSVAIMGSIFALTRGYGETPERSRLWFWIFFFGITGFFATLLVLWSNPFLMTEPAPADGSGLNPLLQNPGMIFHPPLLFLGYGGFTVPSCMALAQAVCGREGARPWYQSTRGLLVTAWCFLTAGILLGAWWAYMELGWGGYWAWDPVENASLIPWLIGTAALHTLILERGRGKLTRVNTLLISLTTISGFFATYLVRSGVVNSVHAYGQGPVGAPLLCFIAFLCAATLLIVCCSEKGRGELENPFSREGALCLTSLIFLVLGFIILTATMWPVFSRLWSSAPMGLDARFYNSVCLPLGTLILLLLVVCPALSWKFGVQNRTWLALSLAGGAAVAVLAWLGSYQRIHPLISQFAAGAIAAGCLAALVPGLAAGRTGFRAGSIGAHLGVALCAIGIAFSGPYNQKNDLVLAEGSRAKIDAYELTLKSIETGRAVDYEYLRAVLEVRDADGTLLATLKPEKRAYDKFQGMLFSEVDVAASFGKEVYASVSGLDGKSNMVVQVNIEPMVSWIWLGGVVLSLLPLLNLRRRRNGAATADASGEGADGSAAKAA